MKNYLDDHLSSRQRSRIRYYHRATERGIARMYGISVAQVRAIRATAQPNHPARLAAKERRGGWRLSVPVKLKLIGTGGGGGEGTARLDRSVVPATSVKPPKGQRD